MTASKAKQAGRKLNLRSDWDEIKLEIMDQLLRAKFSALPLREQLIATWPRPLIEGNWWGDRFWGVCGGKGENHLGLLLVQIREQLRSTTLNDL